MSAGLVLMLALLPKPAVAAPLPGPDVAAAADAASSVLSGDRMVRKGNGCSPIEGPAPVPNLRGDAGPVRFERKLWLNLREDLNSGVIRVERQGNHLRAFVQYRVEDLPSDRPVPTCRFQPACARPS